MLWICSEVELHPTWRVAWEFDFYSWRPTFKSWIWERPSFLKQLELSPSHWGRPLFKYEKPLKSSLTRMNGCCGNKRRVGDVVLDKQAGTPRSETGCEKQLSTYSLPIFLTLILSHISHPLISHSRISRPDLRHFIILYEPNGTQNLHNFPSWIYFLRVKLNSLVERLVVW